VTVVLSALLAFVPVVLFLAGLFALDGWKLVRPRAAVATIAAGVGAAAACWMAGAAAEGSWGLAHMGWSRYGAPLVEEAAKGAVVAVLLRRGKIGFLVDAAIHGFAAGTGFAVVENGLYWTWATDASPGLWIVRGCGTALMHGGATAVMAIVAKTLSDRRSGLASLLPGWLLASAVHSVYNHFLFSPVMSAAGVVLVLPLLLNAVFRRSERTVAEWLDVGLDTDTQLLEMISSGRLAESPVGHYLQEIRERFRPEIVVDVVCYLRLRVELTLRAKGVMMMREAGFPARVDEETRAKLAELDFLERNIGTAGRLALAPFLGAGGRDGWALQILRESAG